MSTLIAVYTSKGRIHRCDANCYNATQPHCDCVCQGRNHGKGFAIAEETTAANAAAIAAAFADANPELNIRTYRTNGAVLEIRQRALFPA